MQYTYISDNSITKKYKPDSPEDASDATFRELELWCTEEVE